MNQVILTGDRPTGKLHLGHYVGSLKKRVELQNSGKFDGIFIMIADAQALSDNSDNVEKVRQNVIEVALDYLACGINPNLSTVFVQSQIPELCELTYYFLNLVTVSRLQRNPTVKEEIKLRGFTKSIPAGFLTYPVSQAADITAFNANIVPVGDDQLPMIEQTREIVRSFNSTYGKTLVEPKAQLPEKDICSRLPGLDGKSKMSKSLNNGIYLSDSVEEIKRKIMGMFTDPKHLKIEDPGTVENNPVFTYLDAFCKPNHFKKFLPDYNSLDDLKDHYRRGGLGDTRIKELLNAIIQEELAPIRAIREDYQKNIPLVYEILSEGSKKARGVASETSLKIKRAMGINYFEDENLILKQTKKFKDK